MVVCSTTHLYHYLLHGDGLLESILEQGLRPLSAMPENPRWQQQSDFFRGIYSLLAEPVLKRPFTNSGIFLTPIDFRRLPGSSLERRTRIAVPVGAIPPDHAVLSYELDGNRVVLPLTPDKLAAVAQLWPAAMVTEWFGRNPNMNFFYVPQVAAVPEGGIAVQPAWVEPGNAPEVR
jgi:hypothetical protein